MADAVNALWYASRGTGVVALLVLTLVVVLGVLAHQGKPFPGTPQFVVTGLHRNASLLAMFLLVIHIVTIVFDTYAKVGWIDVVIPFRSDFEPFWMGVGTLSAELFAAVVATSLLRGMLGRRTWRAVHLLSYAAWPMALGHTLGTGTDAAARWMLLLSAACIAVAVASVVYRLVEPPGPEVTS